MKCREIMNAPLSWWCDSRSEPGKEHHVSWLAIPPSCTCNAWAMGNRKHMEQHGKPYICAHLRFCKDHCWDKLVEDIRDQHLAQ